MVNIYLHTAALHGTRVNVVKECDSVSQSVIVSCPDDSSVPPAREGRAI